MIEVGASVANSLGDWGFRAEYTSIMEESTVLTSFYLSGGENKPPMRENKLLNTPTDFLSSYSFAGDKLSSSLHFYSSSKIKIWFYSFIVVICSDF